MATKNLTPAEASRQKAADTKAKVDALTSEVEKVAEALDTYEWTPGESTLPLLDLERAKAMLATRLDSAERIARRAAEDVWPSETPAAAEMVAFALDGVFMEGAPAFAYDTDPGAAEAEKVEFRCVQVGAHRINPDGSVRGKVRVSLVGPSWSQQIIDASNKVGILDHLHASGVTPINAGNSSREVARRWRESLEVEFAGYGQRPFVGRVSKGEVLRVAAVGGWDWRRATDVGNRPGIIGNELRGGGQVWTVADASVKDGVQTTGLSLSVTVAEPATDQNKDLTLRAIAQMAGRAVVPGVGRVTSVSTEAPKIEPYSRPVYPGSDKEVRGFVVTVGAVAEGTVR